MNKPPEQPIRIPEEIFLSLEERLKIFTQIGGQRRLEKYGEELKDENTPIILYSWDEKREGLLTSVCINKSRIELHDDKYYKIVDKTEENERKKLRKIVTNYIDVLDSLG